MALDVGQMGAASGHEPHMAARHCKAAGVPEKLFKLKLHFNQLRLN